MKSSMLSAQGTMTTFGEQMRGLMAEGGVLAPAREDRQVRRRIHMQGETAKSRPRPNSPRGSTTRSGRKAVHRAHTATEPGGQPPGAAPDRRRERAVLHLRKVPGGDMLDTSREDIPRATNLHKLSAPGRP